VKNKTRFSGENAYFSRVYSEWGLFGLFAVCFLAATILPFSSEAVFVFFLAAGFSPLSCFLVATAGNSLGGSTNLLIGRFSRKYFEKRGKIPWGEAAIERYGSWLAWLSWVPFIGDPLLIALGFYRTMLLSTIGFMILGKAARYAVIWYFFSLTQ